jgi:RIO kinase 1
MSLKRRPSDFKEFKIEKKVFDERTLFAIYKLLTKGVLKSVESSLQEGKESMILSARDEKNNWLAVKVYKTRSDFKSMWTYLAGDPRFHGLKKKRRTVVYNWCKREFKNLKIAYANNISCPKPIDFNENVLVMELIGKGGELAPRIIDLKFDKKDAEEIYEYILDQIEKLFKAGLVHTDLSAYNVLFHGKPYFIDFSQAVPISHQSVREFLNRDIKNINTYFKKLGVGVKNGEELAEKIIGS